MLAPGVARANDPRPESALPGRQGSDLQRYRVARPPDGESFGDSFARPWPRIQRWSIHDVSDLRCPIVRFHGAHTLSVSAKLTNEWHARLRAPEMQRVSFEHSAHRLFEEPGKVFQHLPQDVRPLALKHEPTSSSMP
ncbi:hypothetical protein [Pyxidicoccus sp. MSG2]|uniref:hypothetical protein n=1 Tax=Pyxidicoccus sp. MSG2 TaxID=2996790 RepID=UPI00226F60ED|nr:hypothetical protein [Pyxidicoccus sp. MSG2]MCY1014716.1 hypothetical protein [Pyxidicoccus sp. MSG2]